MIAISQGLGRALETTNVEIATSVDPFNVDARLRAISASIDGNLSEPELARIESNIRAALAYDPIDARLFSILGEIRLRRDEPEVARRYFLQARALSKTEGVSLQRSILWSLDHGDIATAVADADTLVRRWPQRFSAIQDLFLPMLRDEGGNAAIVDILGKDAPWRVALLRYLTQTEAGLPYVEQLLTDLAGSSNPPRPNEIAIAINGYLRAGQAQTAYRLFLFTQTDEQRRYADYIYNPTFEAVDLMRPFDWQFGGGAGAEVTLPGRNGAPGGAGAQIRFLNAPVKRSGLWQLTQLPPGSYTLSADVSAVGLKLPRELFLEMRCEARRPTVMTRAKVPEGTYGKQVLQATFMVPDTGCDLQVFSVVTGVLADSWRYRYQGTLTLHAVRVEKVAA